MKFSEPFEGKEGRWWVEVTFEDGHIQPAMFLCKTDALEFIGNPGTPARMARLRARLGEALPDSSAGYVPLSIPRPPQGPLAPVAETAPPPPENPFTDDDDEREALEKDNELQRLRIENAELRTGVLQGKLPARLASRDYVTGAIGATVWAIASKLIGC